MKKSYFRYLGPILLLILSSAIYYRLSLKSQQTDISNVLDKQQLKILTWEGYADVKYVKQFEKFAYSVEEWGFLTWFAEDEELKRIFNRYDSKRKIEKSALVNAF